MNIISRLLGYLNLQRVQKSEAIVLATPQLSGRWTRVITEDDIVLGYDHRCVCGETKKYLANEAAVDTIHRCVCSRNFNLKKSLLLTGADTRLVKRSEPQRAAQTVGDAPMSELYHWTPKHDAARARAFDDADPSYMGPGFGEPRR